MFVCLQIIESEDDRSKSEQLFDRYAGLMYCIASKYLSNEQDRDEVYPMSRTILNFRG